MKIQTVTELLGGPSAVARILGLKTPRYVADVCSGARSLPPRWVATLHKALEARKAEIEAVLGE